MDKVLVRLNIIRELGIEWYPTGDLIIVVEHEEGGLFDGLTDGREGLVTLHALEVVDGLEIDGVVARWRSNQTEQELVDGEISVAEVEFDLTADLARIA
jgi:hypothetical protein